MTLSRGLRIFLALALLAAWTNALVHPIEHVDESGGFVHLADGRDDGQRNGNALDPVCDVLAAVVACAAGPYGFQFPVPQGVEVPAARHLQELPPAPLRGYRSQAPPQFS